ncbi:MAG TPA: 8-oxoguanine deaminase [Acidimicrobiales bacterium]|nr:8-oxoguanine deaminase [Acidimicrobiales bacterium]
MSRTVLRNSRHPGDVVIEDGLIAAVGGGAATAPRAGDHVVDCEGGIVTAGLVNTHHHLYQWLTRGRAHTCTLFEWLTELYPVWARMRPEDVGAAALRGIAELALSGVTTLSDHHYVVPHGDDSVFDAIAEAARTVGTRLYLSRGSMDLGQSRGGLPPDEVVEDTGAILASTEAVARRYAPRPGEPFDDLVHVVVAPCSPFSVTPELMAESARLARRLGLRLHTHLAETLDEERDALDRFGSRPLDVVEELGWLGDDVWFAHGIHLDDAEVKRIGAAGTGVAHCPSSNGRLGAGLCRVRDLLDAGAPVGLGVDGPASGEPSDLFGEMRQALYVARLRSLCPSALSPGEALQLATSGGARCLGRPDLGRLEPGAVADVAVWPADDLGDIEDPVAALVLGPTRRVRHLFVRGAQVVEESRLTTLDIETARQRAIAAAKELWS